MPCTSIKWSTAGDAYVNDGEGGRVVVMGKSGNAPLRTQAGVYCNVRPYGCITVVRCMPCLPYSQNKAVFDVSAETGIIHSEMNTPGIQMAYAGRRFLQMVHETGKLGRVAFKPTSSILIPVDTVTRDGEASQIITKGRHDPCVLPRAVPMVEAMSTLVICDHLLQQRAQCGLHDPTSQDPVSSP